VIADRAILDVQSADGQAVHRHRGLLLRCGFRLLFLRAGQIAPVVAALGVHRQTQAQAAHAQRADLHFALEQQRQQLDANPRGADFRKRLRPEALGIAELDALGADREPRENLQLQMSQFQLAPGLLADLFSNLVAVIVGVEQQGGGEGAADQQREQRADDDKGNFQGLGHGFGHRMAGEEQTTADPDCPRIRPQVLRPPSAWRPQNCEHILNNKIIII
jgi:hypothetical protein